MASIDTSSMDGRIYVGDHKVRKRAKIRNGYNQAPHLTQDTNGKVTTSQLDITNESQEVSPFPAGHHNASINKPARKHKKQDRNNKHINDPRHKSIKLWVSPFQKKIFKVFPFIRLYSQSSNPISPKNTCILSLSKFSGSCELTILLLNWVRI